MKERIRDRGSVKWRLKAPGNSEQIGSWRAEGREITVGRMRTG